MLYSGCLSEITKRLKFYNLQLRKVISSANRKYRSERSMAKFQQSYLKFKDTIQHMDTIYGPRIVAWWSVLTFLMTVELFNVLMNGISNPTVVTSFLLKMCMLFLVIGFFTHSAHAVYEESRETLCAIDILL
jgi:hypothetical protein